MSDVLASYIAQLLYRHAPQPNFAHLVADLCKTFAPSADPAVAVAWDCDDIAIIDFDASRIVVGLSEKLPGDYVTCLTVAVGQSPRDDTATLATTDHKLLCRAVARRLNRRYPSDTRNTRILDEALTSDLIDHAVDALFQASDVPDHRPMARVAMDAFPEVALAEEPPTPNDMDRLIHRLSSELSARTPNVITQIIASATAPSGDLSGIPAAKPKPAAYDAPGGSIAKLSARLFWRKAAPDQTAAAPAPLPAETSRPATVEDLKSVRDALCAQNQRNSIGRLALQTKQTLFGIVSSVADIRRGGAEFPAGRVRH